MKRQKMDKLIIEAKRLTKELSSLDRAAGKRGERVQADWVMTRIVSAERAAARPGRRGWVLACTAAMLVAGIALIRYMTIPVPLDEPKSVGQETRTVAAETGPAIAAAVRKDRDVEVGEASTGSSLASSREETASAAEKALAEKTIADEERELAVDNRPLRLNAPVAASAPAGGKVGGGGVAPAGIDEHTPQPTVQPTPPGEGMQVFSNVIYPARGERARIVVMARGEVSVTLYDLKGRLVLKLFEGNLSGEQEFSWDGRNGGDRVVAAGIYLLAVETAGWRKVEKIAVKK